MQAGAQVFSEAFSAEIINLAMIITGIAMFSILALVILFGWALIRMLGSLRDSNKSLAEQTNALVAVRIEQEKMHADTSASNVTLGHKLDEMDREIHVIEERRKEWATIEVNRGIDRLDDMAATIGEKFEPIMQGITGVGDGVRAIEAYVRNEFQAIRGGLAATELNIITQIERLAKGLVNENINTTTISVVPALVGDGVNNDGTGNGTKSA